MWSYTFTKQQNQNVQMLELCTLDLEPFNTENSTYYQDDSSLFLRTPSSPQTFYSNAGAIISTSSHIGKRDSNLDKIAYSFGENFELIAIYDGHGNADVSKYLETYLLETLKSHHLLLTNFETAVNETFQAIDNQLQLSANGSSLNSGSTALVILITTNQIYLANLGDSKVLSINRSGEVIQLNTEHNLSNQKQRHDLVERGGIVMRRGKQYRLAGQINISRSFGDFKYKPFISLVPQIKCFSKNDIKYLILGTDGFWSQTSNDRVVNNIASQSCSNAESIMQSVCKRPSDNSTIVCYEVV